MSAADDTSELYISTFDTPPKLRSNMGANDLRVSLHEIAISNGTPCIYIISFQLSLSLSLSGVWEAEDDGASSKSSPFSNISHPSTVDKENSIPASNTWLPRILHSGKTSVKSFSLIIYLLPRSLSFSVLFFFSSHYLSCSLSRIFGTSYQSSK